jgi:hypothetical protein
MTNQILNEIERAKRAEQVATWSANEQKMAERLSERFELMAAKGKVPAALTSDGPTPVDVLLQQAFTKWCAENGVRHCPARPTTCAMFLLSGALEHEQMLDALSAISKLHTQFNLACPTTTPPVRAVLEMTLNEAPPRSWKKDEQELWVFLPADIRFAISRRQRDFDKEIRRCQNETAELRKKYAVEKQDETIEPINRPGDQNKGAEIGM